MPSKWMIAIAIASASILSYCGFLDEDDKNQNPTNKPNPAPNASLPADWLGTDDWENSNWTIGEQAL